MRLAEQLAPRPASAHIRAGPSACVASPAANAEPLVRTWVGLWFFSWRQEVVSSMDRNRSDGPGRAASAVAAVAAQQTETASSPGLGLISQQRRCAASVSWPPRASDHQHGDITGSDGPAVTEALRAGGQHPAGADGRPGRQVQPAARRCWRKAAFPGSKARRPLPAALPVLRGAHCSSSKPQNPRASVQG